jgi:methylglutaconyl-CoA hydratase
VKHLKITRNQGILTIALNRPEKRNAFFPEMIQEITTAFATAAQDMDLRAVLLTGHGPSFCSGGDLQWMKSMADYTLEENIRDAEELFAMYWAIRCCPVPVVGRLFGHCFGGGAGLVAVCDIVSAESQTQFCFSEVKWGLVPAVISPFVVERAEAVKVREWFTTAKVFLSPEAQSGGLINHYGTISEVDIFLEETLKQILNTAPEAVRETKKLLLSYSSLDWKTTRSRVTRLIAERRVSAEGQKGLKAFLDKKSPQWSAPPYGSSAKI